MNDKRLARGRRWFEYHCYEGEDSDDAELWHHTHQEIVIVRNLSDEEVDFELRPMYRIRFSDGLEYDCFNDELLHSPREYERPDYSSDRRLA